MSRPGSTSSSPSSRHLVIGNGAQTMWIKMRWEANLINSAHEARPVDAIALMFAAINFAITARSLEDWVQKELHRRNKGRGFNAKVYREEVSTAVPMQPAFRDIANTAKHGDYREENWLGGTVELVHTPGMAGTEREFVLIYHSDAVVAYTSLDMFDQATSDWLRLLNAKNLLTPGF